MVGFFGTPLEFSLFSSHCSLLFLIFYSVFILTYYTIFFLIPQPLLLRDGFLNTPRWDEPHRVLDLLVVVANVLGCPRCVV
jgi:hypothetical protein